MIILFPLRWIAAPVVVCGLLALMLLLGLGSDHWLRDQLRQCVGVQTEACRSIRQQAAQRHVELSPR
jgi:hypothetical protein